MSDPLAFSRRHVLGIGLLQEGCPAPRVQLVNDETLEVQLQIFEEGHSVSPHCKNVKEMSKIVTKF